MGTYKVVTTARPREEASAEQVRLIEARTKASAIAHVAKDSIVATEATTEDILALGRAGVTLEKVGNGE